MGRSSTRRFSGQMKAGARCSRTREILPVQFTRENFPVNSLLFTGSADSLFHRLYLQANAGTCRNRSRLTRPTDGGLPRRLLPLVLVSVAQPFVDIFRKRSQRQKPSKYNGARRRRAFGRRNPTSSANGEESRPSLLALYLPPPSLACCGRQPLRRFSIILTTDVIASDSAANTTTPAKTISTW